MTNKKHFYENMQAMAECLAKDPETKDRYDKATHGGKGVVLLLKVDKGKHGKVERCRGCRVS